MNFTNLDPGIASMVKILRGNGIETFESCEGGVGHSFPEPTIRFYGEIEEGYRAYAIANVNRLPVATLRRYWDVIDKELVGPSWELIFWPRV